MESGTRARVQHVNKASSDELLSKFAQVGSDNPTSKKDLRLSKRQKRKLAENGSATALAERKSLLPPTRPRFRSRNFKNKSILGTIEKTWRKTVEGASKVFMEKHHNRHKRLISDIA